MHIQEIGGNAIPSTIHDKVKKQNKDGHASHELQIFSFESISVATNNFSTENKLGEGGFGPVYKVNSSLSLSLSLSLSHTHTHSLANPFCLVNKLTLEVSPIARKNLDTKLNNVTRD